MLSQLETVLEISAYGTLILFAALAGLLGLMYLLTARWPARAAQWLLETVPGSEPATFGRITDAERERRLRAVAIAVAAACATVARNSSSPDPTPSQWRRLHLARRLNSRVARTRAPS
jgi:hypothetical protein